MKKKRKNKTYLSACTFGDEDEEEKPYPEGFPKMRIVIRKREREREKHGTVATSKARMAERLLASPK